LKCKAIVEVTRGIQSQTHTDCQRIRKSGNRRSQKSCRIAEANRWNARSPESSNVENRWKTRDRKTKSAERAAWTNRSHKSQHGQNEIAQIATWIYADRKNHSTEEKNRGTASNRQTHAEEIGDHQKELHNRYHVECLNSWVLEINKQEWSNQENINFTNENPQNTKLSMFLFIEGYLTIVIKAINCI